MGMMVPFKSLRMKTLKTIVTMVVPEVPDLTYRCRWLLKKSIMIKSTKSIKLKFEDVVFVSHQSSLMANALSEFVTQKNLVIVM